MTDINRTIVKSVQIKHKPISIAESQQDIVQWIPGKKKWSEKLFRNMTLAAALLIGITAVQLADETPDAQAVFDAIHEQITWDMEDQLGKLTFVSNMLPEASMVFWNGADALEVMAPVQGEVMHRWSSKEPYVLLNGRSKSIFCGADGEVMSVAHSEDEERIVRIRHAKGVETLYGNLTSCFVAVGDPVRRGDIIGQTSEGSSVYFEIRQDGRSVDPVFFMDSTGDID